MECQICGQEIFLPFQCPYCGDQFCSNHRLPENHKCPKIDLARASKRENTMVFREPGSLEYKFNSGSPRLTKSRIYFSYKEPFCFMNMWKHFLNYTMFYFCLNTYIHR